MAKEREVIGECVEAIRVEVGKSIEVDFGVPCIFRFGAQCLIGSVIRLR